MLGRPRQSRARGLGRAILDTIPIVKFGEKEPPKPTDVELASTSDARDAENMGTQPAPPADQSPTLAATATGTDAPAESTMRADGTLRGINEVLPESQQEGIAPAQPLAAAAVPSTNGTVHNENLGCSICTEDFEKGQDLRVLPCDHKFHPECVDPWLLNVSGTCPLWSVSPKINIQSIIY